MKRPCLPGEYFTLMEDLNCHQSYGYHTDPVVYIVYTQYLRLQPGVSLIDSCVTPGTEVFSPRVDSTSANKKNNYHFQ